ncbi:hypothetical protein ACWGJ9_10980 [Curtobacterium citreum]
MTTFNEHDHPRTGAGKFTEKQQSADAITLRRTRPAAETANHLTIDVMERLEEVRNLLDSGNPAQVGTAYEMLRRADTAMTKARAQLARAHIGETIRGVHPTAVTLELSNWGSSSEPTFVPTAIRDGDGGVLWNSDDRKDWEKAPPWQFSITEALYDIDGTTITVEPDGFRGHARDAIRLT